MKCNETTTEKGPKMDIVKQILEHMKKGHATTLYGAVVIRVGDSYIVGMSPSIRDRGVGIDAAVAEIARLASR